MSVSAHRQLCRTPSVFLQNVVWHPSRILASLTRFFSRPSQRLRSYFLAFWPYLWSLQCRWPALPSPSVAAHSIASIHGTPIERQEHLHMLARLSKITTRAKRVRVFALTASRRWPTSWTRCARDAGIGGISFPSFPNSPTRRDQNSNPLRDRDPPVFSGQCKCCSYADDGRQIYGSNSVALRP